jgi:chaperone modulatory protein CbpM
MKSEKLIPVKQLCSHYQVEMSFFSSLQKIGLVEMTNIKRTWYIHQNKIIAIEKVLRLHHELEVNMEGIDVIFNLLHRLEQKENELSMLKNRLRIYES